jgi:hypothetical protein
VAVKGFYAGFGGTTGLAWRRLRTRPLAAASTLLALVIAAGLVGWTGLGVAVAQERSARLTLSELPPQSRALRVVYYTVAGQPDVHARQVASAARRLSDLFKRVDQVTVWHPVAPADESGTSFVVPSNLERATTVFAGRLPRGSCGPARCEALAISGRLQPGQRVHVGPVAVTIVGTGSISPAVLPTAEKLGMRQLVVARLGRSLVRLARLDSGSTSVTTAPLDPSRLHAAKLGETISRLRAAVVSLNRSDQQDLVQATAPTTVLASIEQHGTVARNRLLLISGQAAALVIAFAAFVASTRRRDIRLLEQQLIDLGANRFQAWLTGALDVIVPGLLALVIVFGGLVLAAAARAPTGIGRASFVETALPLTTVVTVAGVVIVAVGLLAFTGSRQIGRRFGLGPLEAVAVGGLGLIVWQATSTKDLSARALAGKNHSPVLLLLPALTFFVCAVVLVRVLPLLVRLAERYSRHSRVSVRLAFLGAARQPGQVAIATTFLAIAVGTAAFALDYRATLERQASDQANFAAGALWRVVEARPHQQVVTTNARVAIQPVSSTSDVEPLTRYAAVSGEAPTPVLRLPVQQLNVSAGFNQRGTPMTLLALPANELADVRGWRDNFTGGVARTSLARELAPKALVYGGPKIDPHSTELRVWTRTVAAYPTNVVFWFLLPDKETRAVSLQAVSPSRWTLVRYSLPRELRGSELVGIDLDPVSMYFPPEGYRGTVWLGPVQQSAGGSWSDVGPLSGWKTVTDAFGGRGEVDVVQLHGAPVRSAVRYLRHGTALSMLRRQVPSTTAIPVLASPSVAASAVDGQARFVYDGIAPIRIKVVGVAKLFPTISDSRFIVADYTTAYTALNVIFPGVAPPSEAWFFDPQKAAFATALANAPFRLTRLVSVTQNEQALLSDPLASGTRSLLLATAVISALLALLGLVVAIRASLRDESAILAEYEALGIPPSILARGTTLRLALLSVIGVAAGAAGGFLATRLVGALVAVTGAGTNPVPPIATTIAWAGTAALLAIVVIAAVLCTTTLARRAFARPVAERLRA